MYIFGCTFQFLNILLYVLVYVCVHTHIYIYIYIYYLYLFYCCGRTISYPEMSHRLNPMSTYIECSHLVFLVTLTGNGMTITMADLACPVLPVLIMVVPFVAAFLALRFQLCQQRISVLRFVQKTPLIEIVEKNSENLLS